MLLLKAENLKKVYGDRTVLEVKELLIYSGDRIGVVGANGAGKTMLLRLIEKACQEEAGIDAIRLVPKVRLAFVMLFVSSANVLLLDEPTNYLDLISIQALERQLQKYEGAVGSRILGDYKKTNE